MLDQFISYSTFSNYNCEQSAYDINDFIIPPTENSAVTITTRITEYEYVLKLCGKMKFDGKKNKSSTFYDEIIHKCYEKTRCILPPLYRYEYENDTIVKKSQLCWFKLPSIHVKRNYQALDYILFIKHFVEFPQLDLVRSNLISNRVTDDYLNTCEYDPNIHPLCPKFGY